jgi:hypothetical protein
MYNKIRTAEIPNKVNASLLASWLVGISIGEWFVAVRGI